MSLNPYKRLYYAGAELEGLWQRKRVQERGRFVSDGSVQVPVEAGEPFQHMGELASLPMPPRMLPKWVRKEYPSRVNESCGLHVHLSTVSLLDYSFLMEGVKDISLVEKTPDELLALDYASFLCSSLLVWGKHKAPNFKTLFHRLEGKNKYCLTSNIDPRLQSMLENKSAARYRAINFCYALHGTVEVRVLPAFEDADLASEAVDTVLRLTSLFLEAKAPKKEAGIYTAEYCPDPKNTQRVFFSESVGDGEESSFDMDNGDYSSERLEEQFADIYRVMGPDPIHYCYRSLRFSLYREILTSAMAEGHCNAPGIEPSEHCGHPRCLFVWLHAIERLNVLSRI